MAQKTIDFENDILGPIGSLKEDLEEVKDKKITKFYASNQGETHLADSDSGKIVDMSIYGKSEQFTTTGKNLLPFPYTDKTKTENGVTFDVKDDGKIHIYGTATETTYFNLSNNIEWGNESFSTKNERYKLIGGLYYNAYNKILSCAVQKGETLDKILAPMVISINETNSTYEPYTGGIPSPSSDYPQEIKSVVNPVVKVCGKNLMPYPKDSTVTRNGVTLTVKDGIYILTGKPTAPTWFNLYPEVKNTTSKTMLSDIPLRTKDKKIVMVNGETGYSVSFRRLSNADTTISIGNNERKIADEDTVGIFLYISNTDVNYDSTFNIMITDPADSETYEPYTEQTIQLPYTLNAIPVSSGGNVTIDGQQYIADRIVEKDGVLGIERRVIDISKDLSSDSMDFDGSNEKTNKIVYHVNHKLKDSIYPCASDILPWKIVWNVDEEGIYVDSDSVIIRIDKTRCGTEEQAAKEWMDATMSKHHLYACLSDNVFEPLDQDSQEQLKELHVNYPVTNITVGSEELDGYAVFNYPISMENGWNYVKQQLGDTRDYIYDMDAKAQDIDIQSAEAYVNSEYAVALTELEI